MGRWVAQLVGSDYVTQAKVVAECNRGDSFNPLLDADVVIDFSSPEASVELAEKALQKAGTLPVFVVGSTGWKGNQLKVMEALAAKTPLVLSSNFSTGVLALQRILRDYAPVLTQLGYKPVMVEAHHQHKKDAPSGTAILLNRTIETAAGIGPVQTHSIRSGEVIGDHEVTFYGPADRIVLSHSAQDRSIFARGAIDVALWAHRRRNDLATEKKPISMDRYFDEIARA